MSHDLGLFTLVRDRPTRARELVGDLHSDDEGDVASRRLERLIHELESARAPVSRDE